MSRNTIIDDKGRFEIAYGWDNPMQTFFFQLSDNEEKNDEKVVKFWLGTTFKQFETPESMMKKVNAWLQIAHTQEMNDIKTKFDDKEAIEILHSDYKREKRELTELQKRVNDMFWQTKRNQ